MILPTLPITTRIEARRTSLSASFAFAFLITLLTGCSNSQVEQPPAPTPAPSQGAEPAKTPETSPPTDSEAQQAVKRVFKDSAVMDSSHKPSYVAGDFNGDLSQDLAVVLKVAPGNVAEMNEQYPAWMLRDPFAHPGLPLVVEEKEMLLAIIHGHGPKGWRDPEATQTYLLKNAAGTQMQVQPGKDFVAANQGKKLPRLHGDLIGEVIHGTPGFLYYADITYSWFDPKTYKGEPARRMAHMPQTSKSARVVPALPTPKP